MLNQNQYLMFRICNLLQLHLKSIFYIFYIFITFFYSYKRYIKNLFVNVTSVTRLILSYFYL